MILEEEEEEEAQKIKCQITKNDEATKRDKIKLKDINFFEKYIYIYIKIQ